MDDVKRKSNKTKLRSLQNAAGQIALKLKHK